MRNLHLKPIKNVAATRAARLGNQLHFPCYRSAVMSKRYRRALVDSKIAGMVRLYPDQKTHPNAKPV